MKADGEGEGDELGDGQEEEEEEEEDGEETFINNHDLIGVKGIIEHQRNEIEKKKVRAQIQDLTASVTVFDFFVCHSLNCAYKTSCTSVSTLSYSA